MSEPLASNGEYLPHLRLGLASASPARLTTLRAAGVEPLVAVSHADEEAILQRVFTSAASHATASHGVAALAVAKARAVRAELEKRGADLVIGCDSMFEFNGEVVGKPHTPQIARERLRAMSGKAGWLHTGHALLNARSGGTLVSVSHARVRVADMSEAEIDAYIATGEPLHVAGSFTIDGLGGPFIECVEGDPHGVVGISLPLVRAMLEERGLSFSQLRSAFLPAKGTYSQEALAYLHHLPWQPEHSADGFYYCQRCHTKHWGVAGAAGIAAIAVDDSSDLSRPRAKILLQLRSENTHGGQTWSIPGGALAWGESIFAGGARECEEETGISPKDLTLLAIHTDSHNVIIGSASPSDVDTHIHGVCPLMDNPPASEQSVYDWAFHTCIARITPKAASSLRMNDESTRLEWFDVEGPLPSPLHPAFEASWPAVKQKILRALA